MGELGPWWPSPRADSWNHPQLDDFVGAHHPDYNEEEEEQKYFRRKRLGVIKNVVAASLAGTLTYGVYLGMRLPRDSPKQLGMFRAWVNQPWTPQVCCRCS